MGDILRSFLLEAVWLYGQMAPYLTLGFIFAGLLYAFVPRRFVGRHLGSESVGSATKAALLGVPMPLCSCGVIPTGIGLHKRGASRAATVSFLISTPQTGVDSILVTYGFFGWVLAVFRPLVAFISGIIGGVSVMLFGKKVGSEEHLLKHHKASEDELAKPQNHPTVWQRFARGMRFAFIDLLGDIALWLVVGILIAAAISLAVPDDFFADKLGGGLPSMLLMMVFGVPLYVCSTASVPIAAVLMTKGISAGAAFVFLMTGPATNAATMMIIARAMGWRVLGLYLGSIVVLAIASGLGLDYFVSQTGLTVAPALEHVHKETGWLLWGSGALLGFFLLLKLYRWSMRKIQTGEGWIPKVTELKIEGMNCSHCVANVTESLKAVPGVRAVDVVLETGKARIEGDAVSTDALHKAVEGAGYKVKG